MCVLFTKNPLFLIQERGVDYGPCHRSVLLLAVHNFHPSVLQPDVACGQVWFHSILFCCFPSSFQRLMYSLLLPFRACFNELQYQNTTMFMVLDYVSDALYYTDTFVRARTGQWMELECVKFAITEYHTLNI